MRQCSPVGGPGHSRRIVRACALLAGIVLSASCGATMRLASEPAGGAARIIERFPAPEASQAVAVDDRSFYAIGNDVIARYDKKTGERSAIWRAEPGSAIAHLNSGLLVGGELHCAHSNYPQTPMISSIEVFDAERLVHLRSVPLPDRFGSATWIEQATDGWWVAFAHYAGRGGIPGKGPEATRLVLFSKTWEPRAEYAFPAAVIGRWDGMSSSGGVLVRPGVFVTTGHHRPELYVLAVPDSGHEMTLRSIVPIESEGQGVGLDRGAGTLYSIQRRTRQVLVSRLPNVAAGSNP